MNDINITMNDDIVPVVEECPPPPSHYKLFLENTEALSPPLIPSDESLQANMPFRHVSPDSNYDFLFNGKLFEEECKR
jgi:hypothetical protein